MWAILNKTYFLFHSQFRFDFSIKVEPFKEKITSK